MRTSACCRPDDGTDGTTGGLHWRRSAGLSRGFTLLEILIVMALLGLITALAVPSLQRVSDGLDRATRRDTVLSDIGALSYRAWVLGQSFQLDAAGAPRLLRDGSPVLALPAGWRIDAEPAIAYSFSGHCSGGALTLRSPGAAAERLVLAAPLCRVQRGPT